MNRTSTGHGRKQNSLGLFIRSLVGLDREAAKAAFGEFLAGKTLTANQIDFINLIVDHLTENGTMPATRLYESPFTDIAPTGPEDLFPSDDVDAIISILNTVPATADPASTVA